MAAGRGRFPVALMAGLLGVSRSGFYSWLASRGCGGGRSGDGLAGEVLSLWGSSGRRWGARTIRARLAPSRPALTLYRVRGEMRGLGMRGLTPPRRVRATVPDPGAPARPGLVRRDLTSPVPAIRLVGGITYLRTGQGWLYLATVIDLCTRMVVGWSMSGRMTADVVVSALEVARGRGYVAEGAIFHSDRGSQCTSRLLAEWARGHHVRLSVGRTGGCHDSAVAESFFGTPKNEMYDLRPFATRAEARVAVIDYVGGYCSRRRPHPTIGYRIPAEVMAELFERTRGCGEGVLPLAAWLCPVGCPKS